MGDYPQDAEDKNNKMLDSPPYASLLCREVINTFNFKKGYFWDNLESYQIDRVYFFSYSMQNEGCGSMSAVTW